ncbi:Vmc-like lipoprotein signal peptide domain-containing protein [Spiroplasma tabanidicola]|uniref:Lipoprotein n=1 Tax=Spiroplasma tabanidicola TaxID=324079 RepID=A0A6I6CDV9_9MOLU|nr:hypothetical protein [Spiroplasma tabanidicola]QGS52154.1 hypothetical protein STABA_v1c07980 [Spiroplasma tabanidicola]
MKKLMGILSVTASVASAASVVVACAKDLEYAEGFDDAKFLKSFPIMLGDDTGASNLDDCIEEGKLKRDFLDTKKSDSSPVSYSGTFISGNIDNIKSVFKGLDSLKNDENTAYILSVSGKKGKTSLVVYVIKLSGDANGFTSASSVYKHKITIPAPEAKESN